jgi:hypothetical protein
MGIALTRMVILWVTGPGATVAPMVSSRGRDSPLNWRIAAKRFTNSETNGVALRDHARYQRAIRAGEAPRPHR